jgi:hypothetical protein
MILAASVSSASKFLLFNLKADALSWLLVVPFPLLLLAGGPGKGVGFGVLD